MEREIFSVLFFIKRSKPLKTESTFACEILSDLPRLGIGGKDCLRTCHSKPLSGKGRNFQNIIQCVQGV